MYPRIGILIVGDELLSGRRQDKHLAHVISVLKPRGLSLAWVQYLGDDEAVLAWQIRQVRESGDICFCFGGIGATPDDRTRQAMAAAHDVPLMRHPDALREIEQRFGVSAYPHRVLMADLPQGASLIPNSYNRVPGFSLGEIHCLPGFPEMAWPMLEWLLEGRYTALRFEPDVLLTLTVPNAHESELIPLMNALQNAWPALKLSSLPKHLPSGGRIIEFGVSGKAVPAAAMYAGLKAGLLAAGYTFEDDSGGAGK